MTQIPILAAAIGDAIEQAEDLRWLDDHPDEPATPPAARDPQKWVHENSRLGSAKQRGTLL